MNILVIESDRLLAGNLLSALKTAGHRGVWHADLQSAIESLDQELPDVIICELMLSGRSGAEFLYELRSYPEWQNLPVIIWSSLAKSEVEPLQESFNDLGISSLHHKSTTSIKDLLQSLDAQFVSV